MLRAPAPARPRTCPAPRRAAPIAAALLALAAGAATAEDLPPIDTKVEGFTKHAGLATLYAREAGDAGDARLLAAIPPDLLEQPLFLATSVTGGSEYAGWQWADRLVRLERRGRRLLLVELNTQQRTTKPQSELAEVVRRTYADRLLATLDIEAQGAAGEALVDLGALLAQEQGTFFGPAFSVDASLARFPETKAFPKNVEVSVEMPNRADGTFVTLHYSLSSLPPLEEYTPRRADDRVGYFQTSVRDYSEGDPREGRMLRLVNRWKLEKADPELAVSPPKEPIVFHVERTVPVRYRPAVHAGILAWNRAFEPLGITGALVVRQQTDTQFTDLDPEDVRYNFFRWITSETPFAMGPSRVDPRSGRILDADIIFDDAMLRGSYVDYDLMVREAPDQLLGRAMRAHLERRPDQHPLAPWLRRGLGGAAADPLAARGRALLAAVAGDAPALAAASATLTAAPAAVRATARRGADCRLGEVVPHQVALARLALGDFAAAGKAGPDLERFLFEVVQETVMHEVGHTLGLRHNFAASTWLDLDAANAAERPEVLSASVMDYHPVNLALGVEGKIQGRFMTGAVGPYDHVAVEYGYALVEEGSDELKAIPRKVAEQGLPYGTDEDTGAPDPGITRWDLGRDPVRFAEYRLATVTKLWAELERRAVADGESWSRLRRALDATLFELGMSGQFVARVVGGLRFARDHKGDPKARPPIAPVTADEQRRALRWVCENVFSARAFAVPPELRAKAAASRWADWASPDDDAALDYSLEDRVLQMQTRALFLLTADDALARLWENERRPGAGEAPLTLPELFETLEASLWGELDQPREGATALDPTVSAMRQGLQDTYVRRLTQLALAEGIAPPVASKLAWSRLGELERRFEGALAQRLDPYTRAHLAALRARMEQAREPEFVHIASGCGLARPAPGGALGWAALGAVVCLLGAARGRAVRRKALG